MADNDDAAGEGEEAMDVVAANRSLMDQDDDDDEEEEEEEEGNNGNHNEEDDDSSDPLSNLSPAAQACIQDLKVLAERRNDEMSNYLSERAALERKYAERIKPLYEQRKAIAPTIPQFWACALTNHDTAAEYINENDVKALEHLIDITNEDREDGQGFKLSFHFQDNPYFTNSVITKTYHVPNLLLTEDPTLKQVIGDTIHWKPGKSLTHRDIVRKQRGKGKNAGRIRTVTKQEELESFFSWFSPPSMPQTTDEMDEEEIDRLDEIFDEDYELAQAIRSDIIPNAVLWFTGEANEEDDQIMPDDYEMLLA